MEILVKNLQKRLKINTNLIKSVAEFVLKSQKLVPETELSVALVSEQKIKDLNKKYLKEETSTDVLAFPLMEPIFAGKKQDDLPLVLLGDVVISPEVAQKQAELYETSLNEEIALLIIHGILHLLGYNDNSRENKEAMTTMQDQFLADYFAQSKGKSWNK